MAEAHSISVTLSARLKAGLFGTKRMRIRSFPTLLSEEWLGGLVGQDRQACQRRGKLGPPSSAFQKCCDRFIRAVKNSVPSRCLCVGEQDIADRASDLPTLLAAVDGLRVWGKVAEQVQQCRKHSFQGRVSEDPVIGVEQEIFLIFPPENGHGVAGLVAVYNQAKTQQQYRARYEDVHL